MERVVIPGDRKAIFRHGAPEAASAALAADFVEKGDHAVIFLLDETIHRAEEWAEDVAAFLELARPNAKTRLHIFDEVPGNENPESFERHCDRIAVLSALGEFSRKKEAGDGKETLLVAATPQSILSPCPTFKSFERQEMIISPGEKIPFARFAEDLASRFDYSSEILCEAPAQFAVRGGLVDIYPANGEFPVRIDFFGDEVEEIRSFDPTTQRTTGKIEQVILASTSHADSNEKEGGFFEHVNCPATWILREPEDLLLQFPLVFHKEKRTKTPKASFKNAFERKHSKKDLFLGLATIDSGRGIFDLATASDTGVESLEDLHLHRTATRGSLNLAQFESERTIRETYLKGLFDRSLDGFRVQIAAGVESERRRIEETITEQGNLRGFEPEYLPIGLREGFALSLKEKERFLGTPNPKGRKGILIATAREILGRERSRRPGRSRRMVAVRPQVDQALDFAELVEGDHLVHLQHGVCRYMGIGKIQDEGREEEAITVEFSDGITLHVPLQESHLLSRYVGLSKAKPKLAKLGGKSWIKAKEAAERAAFDLAADLLRLQASREASQGYSFSPDDEWQKEFENAFPFTETPDQLSAIEAVKQDMESKTPMDRLLCGDVGFGKTEVALRAAFKAVMDGRQVAVLAPTTVLCQQHLNVFRDRMVDYPVVVEMLSRFRTKAQQRKALQALEEGGVDIMVGTHRILSSDVKFKDLGLLIVDEEQRFGVRHKESIKKMKKDVDVLTLSATPIPRTLYFAMVGARALGSIETPPVNRRPIRTEVMQHSPEVVRKAMETEIRRGGQVFYLHNKVKTIEAVARRLREQFPKLRIAVGHGQMAEDELEEVMTEFIALKYDVLVCTTIIESGIDIPNCNTILIEGADRFGLSQLYQLRGRVGRFDRQAYAYLLLNRHKPVPAKARKRLSAIKQLTKLGAGFRIALRDLELRGAGNLLGSEQSGHVAGIGFDLYCRLLKQSVARLKGDESSFRPKASVRLDFTSGGRQEENSTSFIGADHKSGQKLGAYLPEDYAQEARLRIDFYRRLANAQSTEEIRELSEELTDRFGTLPVEAEALMLENEIRCLAEEAGIDRVETRENVLECRLANPKRKKEGTVFLRIAGKLPLLIEKDSLLKLKEIVQFLKLRIHAKEVS